MKSFTAFVGKELVEASRTYKLLILLLVFFAFGMMGPLTAKFTPALLSSLATNGVSITIPEPTALDAWTQFFKNIGQLGLIILAIVFSGVVTSEVTRGTLINLLAKGLSRSTVILAKFTCAVGLWTLAYIIAALVSWGYTVYLFPSGGGDHIVFALVGAWLFGVFLLALLIFASTLVKATFGALLITAAVIVVGLLVSIAPAAARYNPLSLVSQNMAIVNGTATASSVAPAVVITAIASVALVVGACLVFRRKVL